MTERLLPTLGKHGLNCVVYSNFAPGVAFEDNMKNCVTMSRKNVAVVSKNFLTNSSCKEQLALARSRLLERRDDSLIIMKLDDVDINELPLPNQLWRCRIDCFESAEEKTWETKLINSLNEPGKGNTSAVLFVCTGSRQVFFLNFAVPITIFPNLCQKNPLGCTVLGLGW